MDKKEIRFEAPEKPEIEGLKKIGIDTSEFNEPEKAEALIRNLNLSVNDTLRDMEDYLIVNPRMVLEGDSPEQYKATIGNLKEILTPKEIKAIDEYIKRQKKNDKKRDKIYYSIEKRTDKFYWRCKIKKSIPQEIKEVLEFFRDGHVGLMNTIYNLLSKDKEDYINCYKCAWKNKPIPNIQEWREIIDGEYRVLKDWEADQACEDYFNDDYLWKQAVEAGQTTEGFEDWKESVIAMDGRGSILNGYDGCEEYEEINGISYYIYRNN